MAATTYAADTPANQAIVDQMVNGLRSYAIALRKLNQTNAALLQFWFNGNPGGSSPSTIVGGYTSSSTIPNNGSGIAGATQVLASGVSTLTGYLQTTDGLNDAAHLDVMVPFAGPTNL